MNKIKAKVTKIKECGDLSHLFLDTCIGSLSLVMLSADFDIGDEIEIGFKESAVAVLVGKCDALSYSNQIKITVNLVEMGEILTKICGIYKSSNTKIISLITTNSAKRLNLKSGDEATFLIKATDMFVVWANEI